MLVAYAMVGASDLNAASAFYDAVLAPLGAVRNPQFSNEKRTWYQSPGSPVGMLAVGTPFEGAPAAGNGVMISVIAPNKAAVDGVHAKALELGGKDEGSPGPRGSNYFAYFRDLDGNKLAVFALGAS